MKANTHPLLKSDEIQQLVALCIQEDLGQEDLTANLTPIESIIEGTIIARESGVICGLAWAQEVFAQIGQQYDTKLDIDWCVQDAEQVHNEQILCQFKGMARAILSGERTALNILQTLSGTATVTRQYANAIAHTNTKVLDTRKTLPAMRNAQKYAVLCGGGQNHRIGLYDGIIIKENHLRSGKSLEQIVHDALESAPKDALVELEVENLSELERGLNAGIKRIMLDDFSIADIHQAVVLNRGRAKLEVSGSVTLDNIASIAETGVDYISCGALTKHVKALDLSMLFNFK